MAIAVSATDNDDSGELLTSCEDGFIQNLYSGCSRPTFEKVQFSLGWVFFPRSPTYRYLTHPLPPLVVVDLVFGGVDSRENVFNVVGTLTVALRFLSVRDLLGFGCS